MMEKTKTCEVVKLTKTVVDKAQSIEVRGKPRQKLYLDTELKGFGLCVGPTSKTFFAQRHLNGRTVRTTIGRYGVFTVEQARKEAQQLLAKMARGINPTEERRAARAQGITLGEAWELYKGTMKAKKSAPKTLARYTQAIDTYLPGWLDKPLATLTREDVRARHRAIAKEVAAGKYARGRSRTSSHGLNTANDTMRIFRAIWNRARRQHPELPECPTVNVDWFKLEKPRSALSPESLRVWYKAVQEQENKVRRDLLLFTLFTGLRRNDAQSLQWAQVDFKQRSLHIPKPKGGKPFDIPLSDFLIALLKARQAENKEHFPKSPYAFPASSKTGYIVEPRIEVAGVDWTPHDLRRTFITVAESLDISAYALKALVNHSQPNSDVTGGYISLDVERLRAPMQRITDKLRALCEGPGDNVASIGKRRAKK